jgi:hypothetical protein
VVDKGYPCALILEDDARICLPDQLDQLNRYIQATPSDWDVLTFSDADNKSVSRDVNDLIIVPDAELWYTHIYLVSRAGAQKLLSKYEDTGMSEPYDLWLYGSGVNVYCSSGSPFNRVDLGSDTSSD